MTKLAAFGSIDFPVQCLKSRIFSNFCAQNRHDLLAKIVGEVDGTKWVQKWKLNVLFCRLKFFGFFFTNIQFFYIFWLDLNI